MTTNLDLDRELVERVLALSGERTKKAAVTRALEEVGARRGGRRPLEVMGTLGGGEGDVWLGGNGLGRRRCQVCRGSGESQQLVRMHAVPPRRGRPRSVSG